MEKEHDERALEDYAKAIQLDPMFSQAYNNRGSIYARQQKYDLAISDFSKAIELNPRLWEAWRNRGAIYAMQERYDPAIEDFTMAIQLHPDDGCVYALRGNSYHESENNDKAIEDLSIAIELNPGDAWFYLKRGLLYFRQTEYSKAIDDFRKSIAINGAYEYARIWELLAWRRISPDAYMAYINDFRHYVLSNSSDEWVRTISMYYLLMDGLGEDEILLEAKRGRDERENNQRLCEAYYYLGEERLWKKDRKGAEEYFRKSMGTDIRDFIEYSNSKAMLKLMNEGKI